MRTPRRGTVRSVALFVVSFAVLAFAFQLSRAGSLSPTALPASTMNNLSQVYASLVGTFDSSGIVASKSSNEIAVAKCIILKMTGQTPCQ